MSFGIPVRNGLGVGLLASTFLSSLRIGGRPAMSLDFIGTNSLDSRVTFTRATTATFVGSNGLIQTAAINAPRFEYDSVTLAPRGLLIEEARTNIQIQSEDFSTAWVPTGISVSTNSTTAPDGNATADTLTASASPGNIVYLQPVGNGTTYTFSLFVKKLTSDTVQINFSNVAEGPVFTFSTESFSVAASWTTSVQKLNNGWYRITATRVSNTVFAGMQIRIANSGEAIYAWGAQMEAGAFATSYIPTTTATVTRNADVATMTGTNFSSWYSQTEGTFVLDANGFIPSTLVSTYSVLTASDGSFNNVQRIGIYSNFWFGETRTSGVGQSNLYVSNSYTPNTINKVAYTYKANDFAYSANAGAVQTDTSGTVPTVIDRMDIGSGFGVFFSGHIRRIAYYNTRLPNATLQALSA
jgi:hypothetical protein